MKRGFTLLELLIGVTIFAILAGSVYVSLYLGIKVWKGEENRNETLLEAINTFNVMAKRLHCVYFNPDNEQLYFKGLKQELEFFSVDENGDLINVIFYLEPGVENKFNLYLATKKYTQLSSEKASQIELISRKVSKLKFSYYNAQRDQWTDDWAVEKELPNQVKLEIAFITGATQIDELAMVKFINIPVANKITISPKGDI